MQHVSKDGMQLGAGGTTTLQKPHAAACKKSRKRDCFRPRRGLLCFPKICSFREMAMATGVLRRTAQAGLFGLFAAMLLVSGGASAQPAKKAAPRPATEGQFQIVDFGGKDFDGSPALALTLSLPLDAKRNQDDQLQVWEMPSTKQSTPAPRDRVLADRGKSLRHGRPPQSTLHGPVRSGIRARTRGFGSPHESRL